MNQSVKTGFFYGLYMDEEILNSIGVQPIGPPVMAYIKDYRIDVNGKVKAIPDNNHQTWGMVIKLTGSDLKKMYSGEATKEYTPENMLAFTERGEKIPVVCYNLPEDTSATLNEEYLEKLIVTCEKLHLPDDYLNELKLLRT